ncbi:MAG: nucleotide exchange factor GrpE [Candidatus Spechtbacterales bacterium]
MINEKENKLEYLEEDSDVAEKKIRKLRKILKKCKEERQEYLGGWQRALADHQNYIKQKDKESLDFKKFATENVLLQIIPILDNLVLACESVPENNKHDNWVRGVYNIKRQCENVLGDNGVTEIEVKHGDKFNPEYHEAAGEAESGGESGTIAEVLRRGYSLYGKVIRPARVKVVK